MLISSINPASGQEIKSYKLLTSETIETILGNSSRSHTEWAASSFDERARLLHSAAEILRTRKDSLAELITVEMGKLAIEASSLIDKCALVCDYYADHAQEFLADEAIESDASRSLVIHQP